MECLLMKGQLRWCGHLVRMEDSRMPKSVFYSELSCGKRKPGGQYLRYKDVLKRHLTSCGMSCDTWESDALMRSEWRKAVKTGTARFEDARLKELEAKRHARKTRPKVSYNYTYNTSGQLQCNICSRTFKTKFGFASHHCGSTFGNKYRLQEHYRAKHGYEKFKCGHCDFESASAMALRNHERRHRGEKPFVCETCGAKFHAAYLLAQHKQSHRTERLAKCDLCPASFKARNSLHMHKLSVHSARVFACSLCTRVYSSRHYAARHLRRRHRGDGAQLTAISDDRVAVET
ncbi:unnamed protein product [Plutella xylostella]|uniref:(diamondback moth) hypothetical protein n=1 Tax=Plutella xylostella TaxID=51655 RepID=A0A8S4FHI7_PLUXY|nr:unnamed protein product [Plutella xylostella]